LNDLDEAMLTHVSSNNPLVRCRRWSTGRVRCDAPAGSGGAAPVELRDTRGFATAGNTVCVISQDQKVLCWSRGRSDSPPTEVPGITGAESLALLGRRGCVVTAHGGLSCWTVDQSSLTHSAGPGVSLTDARSVALYSDRTCVLRRGGEVSCWDGHDPQQGDITGVAELVTYGRDICALQAGQVRCLRFEGRQVSLGDPVPGVSGVVELASGGEYLCARSESGSVQCWGRNRRSQFGVVPPMLRIALTEMNFGTYPMVNGQSRLARRFYEEEAPLAAARAAIGKPLSGEEAERLGLVTAAPDDIDWADEIRIAVEERAAMSPDALTGLEANLRFAGKETMETRIFGRLTAWQNWIFIRPNAVGEKGALKVYGKGEKAAFDWNRV